MTLTEVHTSQTPDRRPHHRRRRRRPGRFSLTDEDVTQLARHAVAIEDHYGRPVDIKWGKDGVDGQLYILQARLE